MNRPKNFRVYSLMVALAIGGIVLLLREHRPSFLRPDLHLSAYVTTADGNVTVVDLVKLQAVAPTDMLLKPDGGELYVISPEAHGLQAINTSTHEVGDYMVLGSAPTRGVLSEDASLLYVSDTAAGRVTPVDIYNRRIVRDPGKGFPVPAGDSPAALRFDPAENLLLVVSQGSGDLAV